MTGQSTPSSNQILMENSNFKNIYADGNGALAQINAYEMQMTVSNCQFTNITSGYFGY